MKKLLFVLSILIVSATITHAQKVVSQVSFDVIIGNRAPAPNEVNLMRAEEDRHPNITKSMRDIENAMNHLHTAPDDFGGHKAQAEADLKQAWISLRKALYFRIYRERR